MIYPAMKCLRCIFIVALLLVFSCVAVFAQGVEEAANFNQEAATEKFIEMLRERDPEIEIELLEPATEPLDFGQANWHTHWITANEFTPDNGAGRTFFSNGYYYKDGGSIWYAATITLPSGSRIGRVALYSYDNTNLVDYNIYWSLIRFNTVDNTSTAVLGHNTYGSPGYNITWFDPASFYFENYNQFTMLLYIPYEPAYKPDLRWKGVRISYVRTISPAPTTATFSDVPVGSTFHQHIEALVRSGITGGVGGGLYAPSAYVTRGQMAAFLSRALGLHHPDPW